MSDCHWYSNLSLFSSQLSRKLKTALCSSLQMTVETNYAIAIATLSDWLKVSRQFFNQWEAKPIVLCGRDFPALWAFYRQLPRILIGSLDRLLLSWLVAVITLILIFRHLFENRLIMQLIFQEILASHSSSLSNLNSLSLMSAKTSWLFLRAFLYLSWYFVSSVDNSSRRVVTSVLKFLLSSYLKEIQSKPKGKKSKSTAEKKAPCLKLDKSNNIVK